MATRDRAIPWARFAPLLLTLLLVGCATGDGFRAGSVLRSVDNDSLDHSDDQYTSGLSLSYISKPAASFRETPLGESLGGALDERWPFAEQDQRFVIYSLSHRIFTPTDLSATDVVEDDLPYSALLYATVTAGSQSRDALSAYSLTLGLVGPLAFGEAVQSTVHDWIGSEEPEGWDEELRNEPLLNFGVEHRHRLRRFGSATGFGGDVLASASGSVGNLQTQATLASTVRVGYQVPTNFHMLAPFLAEESLGLRSYDPVRERRSFYAFTGLGATALLNAIYLDGNTFADSHDVDHDHHVLRASTGLAGQYGPLLATLSYEWATLPWDHPDGLNDEAYVRLGVSWDF